MSSKRMSESEYSVFGNKKRKTLSLECKIDIINEFDGGMKICEIGRKMDLAESTVRTVIKDRERIRAAVESDQCLNSSVIRHEIFNKMERMLKSWYRSQIRMNNHCIDQSTVCRQAKWIFERLKEEAGETAKDETFLASNGWFNRFKNRCDWLNIAENSDEVLSVDSDSGSSSFLDKYKLKKTMNFLAMIPRSSEVINITAGFSGEEDTIAANNNECNRNNDENGDDCGNDLLPRAADTLSMDGSSTSSTTNNNTNANNNNSHNGNSNSNANHLSAAALLSAAASNPFMYMAAANAISSVNGMNSTNKLSSSFSLMDSECVLTLMRVAAELDCTFLFHCRDGQAHFCFEANDTAVERLRGPELSLVDLGNEVKITECNGGIEIESETWKKTDWTQFTWAIRGKCQKVLLKR